MVDEIIKSMQSKMDKTVEALKKDFGTIRTGKANPMMVEDVRVDYYGSLTPLNQLGKIACPEPRVILITPFEKGMLKDIEKAIFAASLGLTPNNDGSSIRINIPELTGERRKELAKVVKQKGEEKKVMKDMTQTLENKEGVQEIITTLQFRGERILLPEFITQLAHFEDRKEYVIKAQKGKIEVKEFKI